MKCISDKEIEYLEDVIQTISQKNRLKIICMLEREETLCVCDIIENLGIRQNLVSHHLSVLKKVGILGTTRSWVKIYYYLNTEVYNKIKKNIKKIFNL